MWARHGLHGIPRCTLRAPAAQMAQSARVSAGSPEECAMQWQLRVGLVVAILSLGLAACGGNAKPATPADWAAGLCTAEQKFTEAIAASRDNVDDPSSLELAARKDRA